MSETVRSIALAAFRAERQSQEAERLRKEDEERRRHEERNANAEQTLDASPLREWFGESATWDVMAFARHGAASNLEIYDGKEIVVADLEREVYLLLQPGEDVLIEVYVVDERTDSDTHYAYWAGPRVHSAADVGRVLDRREKLS